MKQGRLGIKAIAIRSIGVLLAAAALLPAADALAQQKPPIMVPLLLCPWGCGPTESDTILMNQMIRDGSPVTLLPQETPGYTYNVREMNQQKNWKNTVFGTEDVVIQLALKWGGTPELKEFLPEKVPVRFKLLYGETWWGQGKFFVTFDPNIKSPADFKGKRIALGLRGQSDWGVFPRLFLEHAYGITPQNSDIRHLTPAALTQQLIDGSVDVAVTAFGTEPNLQEWMYSPPLRQLEAAPKPLRYIGVSKEAVDKVNAKFGTTFLHITVPAGKLPKLTEPLSVAINRGFKAAHPDFSEEAAYHIVMSVAKYAPKMKELHVLWRIWSPELMLHGLSDENVHPGAKKAYVELGWWGKARQFPAMTYPQ
ncbi:MAG: TAXI family TRAP transporter solute-binding subunit [Burkholderiales bacterium]